MEKGGLMADHKETTTTDTTVVTERVKAIVLLVVQMYAIAQTGLTLAGFNALPFTSDEVSAAITGVIGVVFSVWSWWRNNNVTTAAVEGQKLTTAIKTGQIAVTQGTDPAPSTASAVSSDEPEEIDEITGTPVISVGD